MTSASGRLEHTMLKIQNFKDSFPELKPNPEETATTEWVMIVGKMRCILFEMGFIVYQEVALEFGC